MNDPERDKFYSAPDTSEDDGEYELEAPDPTVVDADERRGREVAEAARAAIDIDEIYREADRNRGAEIVESWVRNFRFQFRVKHLFIATAVVAIGLAAATHGLLWHAIAILVMLSIVGLYSYLKWEESKHQAEVERKLQQLYARRREKLRARGVVPPGGEPMRLNEPALADETSAESSPNDIWQEPAREAPLQFSLRTLMITITVAAITLGLIRILGGPAQMATILGMIAMAGLVIHALGFEPPSSVILGWWFILVLYVLLSLLGAVWPSLA
jgi:hypothetical protein